MANLFLGGLPTGPDVKRIREALPNIDPGDSITHEQIEAITKLQRKSSRYRTVTSAWRRELLNLERLEVVADPGTGFRCLPADERVTTNIKGFQTGVRKQGKCLRRLAMVPTDELDAPDRAKLDHATRVGALIFQHGVSMMRELRPPKPVPQLSQLNKPDK